MINTMMNYFAIPGLTKSTNIPIFDAVPLKLSGDYRSTPGRKIGLSNKEIERRQAVCYLLKNKGWSLHKIKDQFNIKSHTTVLKGIQKFKGLLDNGDIETLNLKDEVEMLMFPIEQKNV